MNMIDKETLEKLYAENGSISALARTIGKSYSTARWYLQRNGIPINGHGYKSPKTVRYFKENHFNWKGGTYVSKEGYVIEYAPDHPNAGSKGYVKQHRIIMEKHLGRYLDHNEIVHHINGIKTDNRIENLMIMKLGEHIKGHKVRSPRDKLGRFSK